METVQKMKRHKMSKTKKGAVGAREGTAVQMQMVATSSTISNAEVAASMAAVIDVQDEKTFGIFINGSSH